MNKSIGNELGIIMKKQDRGKKEKEGLTGRHSLPVPSAVTKPRCNAAHSSSSVTRGYITSDRGDRGGGGGRTGPGGPRRGPISGGWRHGEGTVQTAGRDQTLESTDHGADHALRGARTIV